jgi:restriction system protein
MARRKKTNDFWGGPLLLIVALPVILANWLHEQLGIPQELTLVLLGGLVVWGLFRYSVRYFADQDEKLRAIRIANVDSMNGIEFEQYLRRLLTSQGYSVKGTPGSGDLGVDLVAERDSDRVAIQVKRYNTKVSRRAISDAVAGMRHYRCNRAMVITNNRFTTGAEVLARSTGCTLVDRDALTQWIVALQRSST